MMQQIVNFCLLSDSDLIIIIIIGSLSPFLSIFIIAVLRVLVRPLPKEEFRALRVRSFRSGQKALSQFTVKPSGPGELLPFI